MRQSLVLALCLAFGGIEGCSSTGPGGPGRTDGGQHDTGSGDAPSDTGSTDGAPLDARGGDSDAAGGDGASSSTDGGPYDAAAGAIPCKRGLAYGQNSLADLTALRPAVVWWYNWAYVPDPAVRDGSYRALGIEYVPMIWGGSFDGAAATAGIPDGATTLLGFNEPNFGSQANLSAAAAAALWPEVEQVADAKGLALVSPAVNFCGGNCQDTDPFHYLDTFFAACTGCRVDKVAFHIYVGCHPGGAHAAQYLINHLTTYEERFTQPLWLTEFACTDATSFADQIAFMQDAVAHLEVDARVERYAWFSGRFSGIPYVDLLGADGQLTTLGQAYVNAPANPDCHP